LRPGEKPCDYCGAKCCRYFALPVDKPKDWEDFDFLRWYLLHKPAAVFVEDACWYLMVQNCCRHLHDDHQCDIYEMRPQICREYNTADCEYDDDWIYEHYWATPEQVEEYAEAVLGPRDGQNYRSAKPQAASVGGKPSTPRR
jgi:Fe-S-cluster containining protein